MTNQQNAPLVAGSGSVRLEYRLRIEATPGALSLGMAPVFFDTIAAALHSSNRRASREDFVAIGFPGYDGTKRGANVLGASVELFGGEDAIQQVLEDGRLQSLCARGVTDIGRLRPVRTLRNSGVAFVRHRKDEKHSLGALLRMRRRSERNGRDTVKIDAKIGRLERRIEKGGRALARTPTPNLAFVHVGDQRIWIEPREAASTGEIGRVSTYGLSGDVAPLYLPVNVTLKTSETAQRRQFVPVESMQ